MSSKKNCLAFYLTVAYGEQQQNAWNAVTELSVETKKLYLFDQEWARGLNSDDISTVERLEQSTALSSSGDKRKVNLCDQK